MIKASGRKQIYDHAKIKSYFEKESLTRWYKRKLNAH
jgi:hypothetical protein